MKHKQTLWVSGVLSFLILITLIGLDALGRAQKPQANQGQSKQIDFSGFPITDFTNSQSSTPSTQAVEEARARKYNNKYMGKITEETNQIFSSMDWEVGLPALPVDQSAAVIAGTVTSAKAHLTPDKTGIFSEFEIDVQVVFKEDPKTNISPGKRLTVERNGGRVRMPSGRIVVSWTNHQNMPRVGAKYVLFLTHDFQSRGDGGNDFNILTGYELRDATVFPLDNIGPGHPITAYTGTAESKLLSDLITCVAKSSN